MTRPEQCACIWNSARHAVALARPEPRMAVRSGEGQTMTDALSILLIRFRRRLIAARAMRVTGMAVLLTAAMCLAAVLTERISGAPLLARTTVVAGLAAGLLITIRLRHMPTLAAAALEIDRQSHLGELLSSAILAERHEDMSGCVIAAARKKAADVDISQLKTGSSGTPMWIAALLIAGLLPLVYRPPATASRERIDEVTGGDTAAQRETPRAATPPRGGQQPLAQEGQTPGASAIMVAAASDRQRPVDSVRRPTRSDATGLSAGGGLAQGMATAPPAPPVATPMAASPGEGTALGSGTIRANPTGTGTGSGQVASTQAQTDTRAESSGVPAEQGTVNAQSFPESYRDVLKAYFAR